VLLTAPAGEAWQRAAVTAADELRIPLDAYVVDASELPDPESRFADAYGVTGAGAVLVRPDGVVGWRALDATRATHDAMREALSDLLRLEKGP
jgi:putative polyketide hydroxylase